MKARMFVLAFALTTKIASAELVNIQWNADGQFAHAAEVRGGAFLEVCGKLPAGLAIDWSFTSSAPLESNIHYHEGKEVIYPAKHNAAAAVADRLLVKVEQDYCWMWANRAQQPIRMNVRLVRAK